MGTIKTKKERVARGGFKTRVVKTFDPATEAVPTLDEVVAMGASIASGVDEATVSGDVLGVDEVPAVELGECLSTSDVCAEVVEVVEVAEVSGDSASVGDGRRRVSVRDLMRERMENTSSSSASDGTLSVKAVTQSRMNQGSLRSVARIARDRMYGGDSLRGTNKCSTKVIG